MPSMPGSGRLGRGRQIDPEHYRFPPDSLGGASVFRHTECPEWVAVRALGSSSLLNAGNFTWTRNLAKGGTSLLQASLHSGVGKIYAVKAIDKRKLLDRKLGPSVRREIILQSYLNGLDGFAVNLFNVTHSDRSLLLLMELACGGSLADLLERRKQPMNEPEARFYVAETAAALSLLHHEQYLHGDVKPRNLCLDAAGHIKLVDFGSSRRVLCHDDGRFANIVPDGSEWITTDYAAPERIGRKAYNPAIDWFALGGVLFTCLTDTPPFSAGRESRREVERRILAGDRRPLPPHLSESCVQFLNGLQRTDPMCRFSFADVREHPWMAGVDWDRVHSRSYQPPFVPELRFRGDTRYFPPVKSSHDQPAAGPGSPEALYASLENFPLCSEVRKPSFGVGGSLGRFERRASPLSTPPGAASAVSRSAAAASAVSRPPGDPVLRPVGSASDEPHALNRAESEASVRTAVSGAMRRSSLNSDSTQDGLSRVRFAHAAETSPMRLNRPFRAVTGAPSTQRSPQHPASRRMLHSTVSMGSMKAVSPRGHAV
jgi:serine/threonine protein kinase